MTKPCLGIMGGTFDPIHNGHLAVADFVQQHCAFSELRLMPCHLPAHRQQPGATAEQRAAMVSLAIADYPKLQLERLELDKDTPSYTADSIMLLKQRYPDQHLAFVLGMDSLCYFKQWHRWQAILANCHLIVCQRPGFIATQGDAPELLAEYQQQDVSILQRQVGGSILLLDNPLHDQAATLLRQQLHNAAAQPDSLPRSVLNYIRRHKLYTS